MEKKLNELNIFALRDLARKTGVQSPTSKKKEELIQGIIEIISGRKQPLISKTKQGRPPKMFGYDFANVFNFDFQHGGSVSLNQTQKEDEENSAITVAGWVELLSNNSAMLWVNKNLENERYFIPQRVLNGLTARMGDRIVAEVSVDENQKIVQRIFSINDCPIQHTQQRKNYSSIDHCLSSRQLVFDDQRYGNLNLKIGENIYLYGDNNNDNTKCVVDLINHSQIENKIYVNISLTEKNKIWLKTLKSSETFVSNLLDETDFMRMVVSLAIERAKRLMELGENVLIVVDDMVSILGVDKDNLSLVKQMVSITKDGGDLGSITLVAVMPNNSLIQIEKLADQRFVIEKGELK